MSFTIDTMHPDKNEKKAIDLLNKAGIGRLWDIYQQLPSCANCNSDEKYAEKLVVRLLQYGNLVFGAEKWSDPVPEIVKTIADLIRRIDNKEALAAEKAQRRAIAAAHYAERVGSVPDCPYGRVSITGKILNVKEYKTEWGVTTKLLILADEGYTVFCTAPSGSYPREKDTRLTVVVSIDEGKIDYTTKHGFGSHPRLVTHHAPTDTNQAVV
jgi:hypothetical protein